jgi:tetratricopeptide (TPR) repeat protein
VRGSIDTIAAQRKSDPKRLSQLCPGELDWIVMKALDKDRNRRYETASAFAADVQRYLADEPVQACPPSASYRLRKFVRRNKGPVLAVSAMMAVLATGIIGTTWGLISAQKARWDAEAKAREARDAALAEAQAKKEALEQKAKAEAAAAAEKQALQAANKAREQAREQAKQAQTALETVYNVITTVDERMRGEAELSALRMQLLDIAMKKLDLISTDAVTSRKADRTMGIALQHLGDFYEQMGMTEQQIKVYERSLDIFNRLMTEEPEDDCNKFDAAISYDGLGEIGRETEADPAKILEYYGKALDLRKDLVAKMHGSSPTPFVRRRSLVVSYVKLATVAFELGDPRRACDFGQEALRESEAAIALDTTKSYDRSELLSASHFILGRATGHLGDEHLAQDHLQKCVELRQELIRAQPQDVRAKQLLARAFDALGDLALEQRRLGEAQEHYSKALELFDAHLRKDSNNPELEWDLANIDYHLGTLEKLLGNKEAEQKSLAACVKTRTTLAKSDPNNIQRRIELMLVQARLGQHEEAAKIASEVCNFAPHHPGKLFWAARAYAQCIPSVAKGRDPAARTPESRKLQEEYASKAVIALRQAVTHGFKDRRGLQTAPDLDPLRENKAFQDVLLQLGK